MEISELVSLENYRIELTIQPLISFDDHAYCMISLDRVCTAVFVT